jgi:vacuolar-type H+-ATPase subunit I/STV1
MMAGRLLKKLMSTVLYFSLATLIAETIIIAQLWVKWDMNRDRLIQMLAVARGIDVSALGGDQEQEATSGEQISHSEVLEVRAAKATDLQLREQALDNALAQMQAEQQQLATARAAYARLHAEYEAQLAELQQGAEATGREQVRRILESVKPKQAKELLVEMLDKNESTAVVMLLREMSDSKRAKIISEFETAEETQKIDDVLRQIRQGTPEADLAGAARRQLDRNPSFQR